MYVRGSCEPYVWWWGGRRDPREGEEQRGKEGGPGVAHVPVVFVRPALNGPDAVPHSRESLLGAGGGEAMRVATLLNSLASS